MSPELTIAYQRLEALGAATMKMLPNFIIGMIVFLVFLFLARFVRRLVQRINSGKFQENLVIVLGRMAHWAVVLLGVLLAVTVAFPSFTPGNLISALGITGIAIGFAFKDIFENFLAGILILVTEPFRIGDQILFGQYEGTIEEIETRATKMRTYDGRLVIIPNAHLYKGSFIVNTAYLSRRLEHDVVIGNHEDAATAKRLMLEAIGRLPNVEADPAPDALLVDYTDAGTRIRIRWWIKPPYRADALAIRDQVLDIIRSTLLAHGIDLPYPSYHVLLQDQSEKSEGDRRRTPRAT